MKVLGSLTPLHPRNCSLASLSPGQMARSLLRLLSGLEVFARMERSSRDSVDIMPWRFAIEMLLNWD